MKIENKENKIENKIETLKAHSRAIWHLVMPCWAVLGRVLLGLFFTSFTSIDL